MIRLYAEIGILLLVINIHSFIHSTTTFNVYYMTGNVLGARVKTLNKIEHPYQLGTLIDLRNGKSHANSFTK